MSHVKEPFLSKTIKRLGKAFGYNLIEANRPSELFGELLAWRRGGEAAGKSREHDFLAYTIQHLDESHAQLCQDLFVLFLTGGKRDGYFVEFGATNGVALSNTYSLESLYGWTGILAEPARCWHDELRRTRKSNIDTRCVWSKSGERLEFNEAAEGELSTVDMFSGSDGHRASRQRGNKYFVDTTSLDDLLDRHAAPRNIDYLSVDTEGSEFEILSHFDFSRYDIRIITVEHNFTATRQRTCALLRSNGYARIFEGFSQWDDWYVRT